MAASGPRRSLAAFPPYVIINTYSKDRQTYFILIFNPDCGGTHPVAGKLEC
jgi:hypothetical protein